MDNLHIPLFARLIMRSHKAKNVPKNSTKKAPPERDLKQQKENALTAPEAAVIYFTVRMSAYGTVCRKNR
jgi:hypothetical protein